MPQFELNGKESPAFAELDEFTQGYIEALFFTEEERLCEESDGERNTPDVAFNTTTMETHFIGGDSYGFDDLDPSSLTRIIEDCAAFQAAHAGLIEQAREYSTRDDDYTTEDEYDAVQAGHDFWLTRNHHGAGFWDRGLGDIGEELTEAAQACGETHVYVGDDGKVHID